MDLPFNSTEAASNRVELVVQVNGTQDAGAYRFTDGNARAPYFDANAVAQAHRNTDRDVDSHSHARTHAYLDASAQRDAFLLRGRRRSRRE